MIRSKEIPSSAFSLEMNGCKLSFWLSPFCRTKAPLSPLICNRFCYDTVVEDLTNIELKTYFKKPLKVLYCLTVSKESNNYAMTRNWIFDKTKISTLTE